MRSQTFKIMVSLCLIGAISVINKAYGQITVGSGLAPAKAALLEVKDTESTPTSATDATNKTAVKGGLGLPRVKLEVKTTLEPFIKTGDTEWNSSNQAATKMKHTGLMVYNLATTTDGLYPGIAVWNGEMWEIVGQGERYFYIPSFNISLVGKNPGDPVEVDLYEEYAKQFTRTGNPSFVSSSNTIALVPSPEATALYRRDQLEYVVTYYDPNVIDASSIAIDNGSLIAADKGKLRFNINTLKTTPDSFLNVVFVIR